MQEEVNISQLKKSQNRKFILIVTIISLVVGFVYFFLYKRPEEKIKPQTATQITFIDINDINTNLLPEGNKTSTVKLSLAILPKNEADIKVIENRLPFINDAIQAFLHELRPSDLNYPGIMQKIKEEIALRINKVITPLEIKDLALKEFIVN